MMIWIMGVKLEGLGNHSDMAVKLKAHGAGQPDHFEGLGEPANIRNR